MTVSTTLDRQYFNGNGVTVAFPFNFRFLANSQIFVSLIDAAGGVTLQTLGVNYSLSGVNLAGGGTVTMFVAPALGVQLLVQRVLPATQETSIRNQGRFFPEIHENVFDTLTMLIQQALSGLSNALQRNTAGTAWNFLGLRGINAGSPINPTDVATKGYIDASSAGNNSYTDTQLTRTVRTQPGETLTTLPLASSRANKVMGFDASGNPVGVLPASGSGTELALDLANAVDPAKGASMVKYRQPVASSRDNTLREKAVETVSAHELNIFTGADPSVTAAQINTALADLAAAGGASKELLFLDTSDWYNINTPMIMRSNVAIGGRYGKRGMIKNTRTSFDYFLSSCLLPGNFHPDFTEDLVYKSVGTTLAGHAVVVLTNPGDVAGFAVGDDVIVTSDAFFLTGGFKCPAYMILNEIVSIVGTSVYLKYPVDKAFAGGITKLDGTQIGRNGVPLFFWKNGSVKNLDFYTNGRFHGDTATLNCMFENVHVRGRSFVYGNTFQRTRWKGITGLVGSGNEHSLCSLHCSVEDFEFTRDPTSDAPVNSSFFGFQENTRNFKYRKGKVSTGDFTSGAAMVNFINAQDCGLDGDVQITTGAAWTGSDISFSNTTATGRLPCLENGVRDSTFNGVSRFRYIDFSGDSISGVVAGNFVDDVIFKGVASSEAIRYQGVVDANSVRRCEMPSGRPLLQAGATSLELVDNYIAAGMNSAIDPDIYTRHIILRNRTSGFLQRLNAQRYLLNQLSQSGTTALILLDADMDQTLTNRDTFSFEIRGSISGTGGIKSILLRINNNTDSVIIPLLQKDFGAPVTGNFVIHGSLYIAQLSLMVSEMDIYTNTGTVREMLQAASTTTIFNKDASLQVIAVCANAADGMTFQKFKCDLKNPMLI